MQHKLLKLDEAAKQLCTTTQALRKRIYRGEIDHIKDGARLMMTQRQVDDHISRSVRLRRGKRLPPPG